MIYDHHIYVGVNLSGGVRTSYELPGKSASWGDEAKVVPTPGGQRRDDDCFMMSITVPRLCARVL